jgi:ABC-type lipoprotein release transport system permease subunit
LSLDEGVWFGETEGVVLGSELAEFEQRRVGDTYLISTSSPQPTHRPVVGLLARTGTQLDGMVLMGLDDAQRTFGLAQRLTAIGLDVDRADLALVRTRYHEEEPLQVVSLSHIEDALRQATESLNTVLSMLAWALLLMTSVVLINASVLRTAASRAEQVTLYRIGFSSTFMLSVSFIENVLLVGSGALIGLLIATLAQDWSVGFLLSHLPYAPKGDLLNVDSQILGWVILATLGVAALATLPAVFGLRRASALDGGI